LKASVGRVINGQINIFEYFEQIPKMTFGGCGKCVCRSCLYGQSSRCPYGECFDDERARSNPYDKAHPGEAPRTAWSNWKTDQTFWCRGGTFYPVYQCKHFVKYKGCQIRECLKCNVAVYQDGFMDCSLLDIVGCEVCYKEFEENGET